MHACDRYIRRTAIKSRKSGDAYYTYRLVETERVDGKVKQHTLLNRGSHFSVPQDQWKDLSARIKQLREAQGSLLSSELAVEMERTAQRYAAPIIASRSIEMKNTGEFHSVDLDSRVLVRPRRVGVEQIALHAVVQLKRQQKLPALGFNRHQLAAVRGNLIARLSFPASERASHQWLQQCSGLGELIGYDFEGMGLERLYQASDLLWQHKEQLEAHLYSQEHSLFGFEQTVTLYDLTNTFFGGTAKSNPKAKHGRSKEKRTDCPLVTRGLVLDGSGFPCKSELFPGNAGEAETLETMLSGLGARPGTIVVMDAGIASENNIQWLVDKGYRYRGYQSQTQAGL